MPASCADAAHMSGQSSDALGQGRRRTVHRWSCLPSHRNNFVAALFQLAQVVCGFIRSPCRCGVGQAHQRLRFCVKNTYGSCRFWIEPGCSIDHYLDGRKCSCHTNHQCTAAAARAMPMMMASTTPATCSAAVTASPLGRGRWWGSSRSSGCLSAFQTLWPPVRRPLPPNQALPQHNSKRYHPTSAKSLQIPARSHSTSQRGAVAHCARRGSSRNLRHHFGGAVFALADQMAD